MKTYLSIALLLTGLQLWASDYYWVGTTNAWTTLSNWRIGSTAGTTPTVALASTDNVFITAGTVVPKLPTTATSIAGLTISSSKSLDLNGTPTFTVSGSVSLQSGSIINSSTTLTTVFNIVNTDVTFGTSTGNLGFTIGAASPNDKITLNITTAKFRNYGLLNCYANLVLTYAVNAITATDNFINELGTNNYRGSFTLNINENTVATKFGESAGTDTFWKTATINKYSNIDFSFGTTNDSYIAVFVGLLTLNGESRIGTNVSNLILGDQCNATFTLQAGLSLGFTKNTNIVLGKYSASKQPTVNITSGSLSSLALPASYTAGNLEMYKTTVSSGTATINLSTIGTITVDKGSTIGGIATLSCNSLNINNTTFNAAVTATVSTAALKIANLGAVTFKGHLTLNTPIFSTATLLGVAGSIPINIEQNLTLVQTTPITTYANTNVNGFKYVVFNGALGDQVYSTNSVVPFYRLDVNKAAGNLQLNSQLFMNYAVNPDNTTDVITINLTKGRILGSETNRLIIYRSRYVINGYTNANYIAAGLVYMSTDATNLPLKKFLPLGSSVNYAPIEITCNTGSAKFISVTYNNQNPQLLSSNFTGGALDVSNCEYWKILELDANLVALTTANQIDIDKVSLSYVIPKCTKVSQTNHAVGYTYYNGTTYTPWEKLATNYVANANAATTAYIAGAIESSTKLLKQQAVIYVTFSYQNVLVLNTKDVYSNNCTITTTLDGAYSFYSSSTGTNSGMIKVHPENSEQMILSVSSLNSESTPIDFLIQTGADGKPSFVAEYTGDIGGVLNTDVCSINGYVVAFKNSETVPTFEEYTTNLAADGLTLPSGVTTFTITTPVGITPTKLEVYKGTTLTGSTLSSVSPISVTGISTSGSYRYVLSVQDQSAQALTINGYFIK